VKASYKRLDCGDEGSDCSVGLDDTNVTYTNFDKSEDDMRRGSQQNQTGTFSITHAKMAWAFWVTYTIMELNVLLDRSISQIIGNSAVKFLNRILWFNSGTILIAVFLFSVMVKYTLELIFKQGQTWNKWIARINIFSKALCWCVTQLICHIVLTSTVLQIQKSSGLGFQDVVSATHYAACLISIIVISPKRVLFLLMDVYLVS